MRSPKPIRNVIHFGNENNGVVDGFALTSLAGYFLFR